MSGMIPRAALADKSDNPAVVDGDLPASPDRKTIEGTPEFFADQNEIHARNMEAVEIIMKNCVPTPRKRGVDLAFGQDENENASKRIRFGCLQKFDPEMCSAPVNTPSKPAIQVDDYQRFENKARGPSGYLSAETSPNSSFDSDRDVNDSQDTIITLPDEAPAPPLPTPNISPASSVPRRWGPQELAANADRIKINLQYAMYKIRTNQVHRSIDQVEVRHYSSSAVPPFYKDHLDISKKQASGVTSLRPSVLPKSYSSQAAALLGPFARQPSSAPSTAPPGRKPLPNFAVHSRNHNSFRNYGRNMTSRRPEPEYSDLSSSDDEDLPMNHAEYLVQEAAKKAREEKEKEEKENKNKLVDPTPASTQLPQPSALPAPILESPAKTTVEKYGMDVTSSAVKSANLLASFRQQARAKEYSDRYEKNKASK